MDKIINLKSILNLKNSLSKTQDLKKVFEFCKQQEEKFKEFNIVLESTNIEDIKISEENYKSNQPRLLEGMPIGIKDNIWVEGTKATCGSKMLYNFQSPKDATVVSKLKKEGAIITCKLNLDEFAMGSYGIKGHGGATINPWSIQKNKNYVPGGSSGGCGSAVASAMVCAALGSDTGGSVRIPAAYCGVVGLKPTYGACSRYGLVAYGSSLDTVGIIAPSVENCEIVWDVIKGKDENDSTTINPPHVPPMKDLKNIRVAVLKNLNQSTECVSKSFELALEFLQKNEVSVEYIEVPDLEVALQTYYIIACTEAMSNLANFDGIRYGFNKDDLSREVNIEEEFRDLKGDKLLSKYYTLIRKHGFSTEVKRRILAGVFFSMQEGGNNSLFITKAHGLRQKYKKFFYDLVEKFDFLLCTTNYSEPISFDQVEKQNSTEEFLADIKTIFANLTGLPALSLPINVCKEHNLPAGSLQIMSKPFFESQIFEIAKQMESYFGCETLF